MMKPGAADAADIHAGTFAYGFQTFENGDVFGGIVRSHSVNFDYRGLSAGNDRHAFRQF
jgi:hypothetical protein